MLYNEARHQVEILNADGVHLRLAAQFARLASRFRAEVRLYRGDHVADGKSVLDILALAAERGTQLDLEARGTDAEEAVAALTELIAAWPLDGGNDRG